ncbi:nuclear transport factor 2 family protein [Amycolatopsis alba]|uniref:Nuclear transport factor 2 family protein n=1 Tax=Amycolatopsis alba DSM 44262 TaxID=1125972 RepID=A0A229RPQ9_AMYAL|nr:nuclear transport factor 2 family protein [Amycolatopsis alba]OXM48633.1 nuclear transport factor 2 family protein [Amycolatopsis alba DSM 44262]
MRKVLERVEGTVSPSAFAFITKQTEFGAMRSETPEAREARVRLYGGIFAADGTLAEAGSAAPVAGRANIENNLRTLLGAFPTFRFTPVKIVVNRDVVFYEAANEAVINGRMVRYPAVYRVVLKDGEVTQGRRYHDRTEWFRPIEKDALRELGRLSGAMTEVRLAADRSAAGTHTKFQEYHGTVRAKGRTIDFGIVVRTGPGLVRYYFDTLPLSYDDAEMTALFTKLLTGAARPAR